MPERSFSISASATELAPDSQGKAAASVTVTCNAPGTVRAQARVTPLGSTSADWFSLPEPERDLKPTETHQFNVTAQVQPGTAPGKYPFRVDVCNTANPDDDYTEGPQLALNVAVPAAPVPPKKGFPLWLMLLLFALVVGGGATALIMAIKKKPDEPVPAPAAAMVKVPNFDGVHIDQIRELLGASAPVVVASQAEPFFRADGTTKAGAVTKQEPAAGADVAAGSEIKVWLQPQWNKVPAFTVNGNVVPVANSLQAAGFNVKFGTKSTSNAALDDKVSSVSPAPGTPLARGSEVTITVWNQRTVLPGRWLEHVHRIGPDPIIPQRLDLRLPR